LSRCHPWYEGCFPQWQHSQRQCGRKQTLATRAKQPFTPSWLTITLGFRRSQRQQLMTLACHNRRNLMERSANGIRKDYAQL
jgi:hypothetical protein